MKVKDKKGKIFDLQMKQYEVGLYVVLSDIKTGRMVDQSALNTTKEEFMRQLKEGNLGLTIIEEIKKEIVK